MKIYNGTLRHCVKYHYIYQTFFQINSPVEFFIQIFNCSGRAEPSRKNLLWYIKDGGGKTEPEIIKSITPHPFLPPGDGAALAGTV